MAHVGVVVLLRGAAPGQLLSDSIQLTLGALLIRSIVSASQRSEGLAISFWRLTAIAYTLLFVAQILSVYNDLAHVTAVGWMNNLLFSFWFVPLAMSMFLSPDHDAGKIDTLIALDFVQAMLVCVAAYVYFFYIPKTEISGELAHEVWTPYFIGYSMVAGAFIMRAVLTRSRDARVLFGRMGIFLSLSGCVDGVYYYGPGRGMPTGAWFDLFWSALLIVPMIIACNWKQQEEPVAAADSRRDKPIYSE